MQKINMIHLKEASIIMKMTITSLTNTKNINK